MNLINGMSDNVLSVHHPYPDKHGNDFNWSLRIQVKQIMLTKKPEDSVEEVPTRRQFKKEKKHVAKGKHVKRRRRVFPIWLRIIVVIIVCAIALIIGAMIGYSVLGDGSARDVLEKSTWQHIIDIVKKIE